MYYTTLHYTTLHYTTLHYTTLHYTTLHYTTLHYTTLYYTTQWCTACPYIKEGTSVKIDKNRTWKINKNVNCLTTNIVYLIECLKCKERYIGESERALKTRLADHRGYVMNVNHDTATGAHFTKPGHDLSHLAITILEKLKNKDDTYRKEREKYFINKFNTFYKGLNKQKGA